MTDQKPVIDGVVIDTEKVDRMLKKIIMRENNNLKTREKTDNQMVHMIIKLIKEEVECY